MAGFRRARRTLRLAFGAANRSPSAARGRRAPEGISPPLRAVSRSWGFPKRDRAGNGSAHPLRSTHPPTRVREWVSYEADPGGGGLPARMPCGDCTGWMYWESCWIRRRSRATSCRERAMGSVGSSAERRRPLPGPVLLCQPCGGHPLLVRKSSVSYPSVCCESARYGARSAA